MQEEKSARLKQFREDVRHRVNMLEKARKKQQQATTINAVRLFIEMIKYMYKCTCNTIMRYEHQL